MSDGPTVTFPDAGPRVPSAGEGRRVASPESGARSEPRASFVIERSEVNRWVARLQEMAQVIAPVRDSGGEECFAPIARPQDVLWDFVNPLDPPKRFLLPQTEPIARIHRANGRFRVEAAGDDDPRILLNLRSCDLKGLLFLRHVHALDLPDESFLRRFDSFTLVNLACDTPCPSGFCVCCGAGPFLSDGYDLQLTALDNGLLAEVGSAKGQRLVDAGEGLLRPAREEEIHARKEMEDGALRSFGPETCHFGSAMRRISTRRVKEELWNAMAPWCLECGGCNLACPTCYCFSVKDRSEAGRSAVGWSDADRAGDVDADGCADQWTRCRLWDSCQYAAFTLEASGHNPRAAKTERMKRRFHHKASAQYYVRDGDVGCVGCGRCIQVCMGTTSMPAVVAAIRRGEWDGGRP